MDDAWECENWIRNVLQFYHERRWKDAKAKLLFSQSIFSAYEFQASCIDDASATSEELSGLYGHSSTLFAATVKWGYCSKIFTNKSNWWTRFLSAFVCSRSFAKIFVIPRTIFAAMTNPMTSSQQLSNNSQRLFNNITRTVKLSRSHTIKL